MMMMLSIGFEVGSPRWKVIFWLKTFVKEIHPQELELQVLVLAVRTGAVTAMPALDCVVKI